MSVTVSIVSLPSLSLAGMLTRTSMATAQQDCQALWERFMPYMPSISGMPAEGFQGDSYGVSKVVDIAQGIFDYYAALPFSAAKDLPQSMPNFERLTLKEGLYAKCTVPSLQALTEAYNFIYTTWLPGQQDYSLAPCGVCFELYSTNYAQNGSFDLYFALAPKA